MMESIGFYLMTPLFLLLVKYCKVLAKFIDDCSDGNVERLIREEKEDLDSLEARIILSKMNFSDSVRKMNFKQKVINL